MKKITLISALIILFSSIIFTAFAVIGDGEISSSVEINDSTTNGPTLSIGDWYGNSMTNIGDLNGDDVQDLAVGAYGDDTGGTERGVVHIHFMNTDGSIDSTVEITDSTTNGPTLSNEDWYGSSITSIGDLNGDGVEDLAVGAYGDDEGGSARGAVHISFMNTDGSIDSTVEINSSTTNGPTLSNGEYYGGSIANIGDLNGDGVQDLAVGASDGGDSSKGEIHIHFMNTDGSIDSTVEINSSTTNGPTLSNGDWYGSSITSMGDLNGDGVQDLAVGAYGDDTGGTERGVVHIHFMNTDGSIDSTVEITDSTTNGPTLSNEDWYGSSITSIGDLNGDGVEDLAVGAYGDDEGGSARGAVHISFMNTDGSIDSTVEINSSTTNGPTLSNDEYYGGSVANIDDLNGDGLQDLVVGASEGGDSSKGEIHIHFMEPSGADLSLGISVDNSIPNTNDTVTYTLTLTNSGPDGATLVEVTDLLPAGLTYSSDSPSQGTYTSGTGVWDVGSVTNGNSATLTISATVTAAVGETVSNSAEITSAAEADPDSTVNNDDSSEDD